jgi:hypothetical protein
LSFWFIRNVWMGLRNSFWFLLNICLGLRNLSFWFFCNFAERVYFRRHIL